MVGVEHVEGRAQQLLRSRVVRGDAREALEHGAPLLHARAQHVVVVAYGEPDEPDAAQRGPDRAGEVQLVADEEHAHQQHHPDRDHEHSSRLVHRGRHVPLAAARLVVDEHRLHDTEGQAADLQQRVDVGPREVRPARRLARHLHDEEHRDDQQRAAARDQRRLVRVEEEPEQPDEDDHRAGHELLGDVAGGVAPHGDRDLAQRALGPPLAVERPRDAHRT